MMIGLGRATNAGQSDRRATDGRAMCRDQGALSHVTGSGSSGPDEFQVVPEA